MSNPYDTPASSHWCVLCNRVVYRLAWPGMPDVHIPYRMVKKEYPVCGKCTKGISEPELEARVLSTLTKKET